MAVHIETGTMVAPGYKSCTLAHLGLVAGMYEELGIGEVIDQAVPQDEERRFVSVARRSKRWCSMAWALLINDSI